MSHPPAAPIRVFLIDDHASFLWGLERLLHSARPQMEAVGSATSVAAALPRLAAAAPDLILLDVDLGGESGLDALPAIGACCDAKVLLLTGLRDKTVHERAVLAGARGVVSKEADAETILRAIARVHAGEIWLDRLTTGRLLVELSRQRAAAGASAEAQRFATLTEREREVVLIAAGNASLTARDIAERLAISENTLRNHLTSAYAKLGVANRLELFVLAQRLGLPPGGAAAAD